MAEQDRRPLAHFHIMSLHTILARAHTQTKYYIVRMAGIQLIFLVTMVMRFYSDGDVSVGHFVGVAGRRVTPFIHNLEQVHTHTFTNANVVACS